MDDEDSVVAPCRAGRQRVKEDSTNYCSRCRLAFQQDAEAFRQEAWDSMPLVLGFPPWDELIKAELDNTIT